jgi:hypothetical protein
LIETELYQIAIEKISNAIHPEQITIRLDELSAQIAKIKIIGNLEITTKNNTSLEKNQKFDSKLEIQPTNLTSNLLLKNSELKILKEEISEKQAGQGKILIDFSSINVALQSLVDILDINRIWILLDEWSEIPYNLQPYLADLIRRTFLANQKFIIKIAAIEHRSNFIETFQRGEYIGLELGADISADINMDDFLVFDNDQSRAVDFFKNLLFSHYKTYKEINDEINTADQFIQTLFASSPVFNEFVRAVEGVPRDALSLATMLATNNFGNRFQMPDLRKTARQWFQQEKQSTIKNNKELQAFLTEIFDSIIGSRKARAFLFPNNLRDENIDKLFDARILHILKKNISSKETPGKRYDVYKIDYGCYVDLILTNKEPIFIFSSDFTSTVNEAVFNEIDVPDDDYRSIRRAIWTPETRIGKTD